MNWNYYYLFIYLFVSLPVTRRRTCGDEVKLALLKSVQDFPYLLVADYFLLGAPVRIQGKPSNVARKLFFQNKLDYFIRQNSYLTSLNVIHVY